MNKILVIQESSETPKLQSLFSAKNFQLQTIRKQDSFLVKFKDTDVIILDSSLNGDKSIICAQLRRDGVGKPVIAMTEKYNMNEKIEILNHGADEVLEKDINPEEFNARISSLLRRPPAFFTDSLEVGDLNLNLQSREVCRSNIQIFLSRKEFLLLAFLMKNKDIPVDRDKIFEKVWGFDAELFPKVVDVYIRFLRKKIDDPFKKKLIKTVYGIGYKIVA